MYGGLDHYMGANDIFENFIRAGPLPVWTERDRDGMKWRKNGSEDRAIKEKITVRAEPWRAGPLPWSFRGQAATQGIENRATTKGEAEGLEQGEHGPGPTGLGCLPSEAREQSVIKPSGLFSTFEI